MGKWAEFLRIVKNNNRQEKRNNSSSSSHYHLLLRYIRTYVSTCLYNHTCTCTIILYIAVYAELCTVG